MDESKITTPAQLDAALESQRVARLAAQQKVDRIRAYTAWMPLAFGALMIGLIVAAHYWSHLGSQTIYMAAMISSGIEIALIGLARRVRRSGINSD